MEELEALLRSPKFGVCGCPGFWGLDGIRGPDGQQDIDTYHPCHYQYLQNITSTGPAPRLSLSTRLLVSPLDLFTTSTPRGPPQKTSTPHGPPQKTSTPCGPPQKTCFFWYHGYCWRGDNCGLAHERHDTWPIPLPGNYVHDGPCHLPFCPLNERVAKQLLEAGARTRPNATEVQSSNTAVMGENKSGEPTGSGDCHGSENNITKEPGRHIHNERDVIGLSPGRCSSTTAPSFISLSLMATPTPSFFLPTTDEQPMPEVTSISHIGTYKSRREPRPKISMFKAAVYPPPIKPAFGSSTESRSEYLHTYDTDARETIVPANLESDQVDCNVSLCPASLRPGMGGQGFVQVKVGDEEDELTKDAHGSMIPREKKSRHSSVESNDIIFQRFKHKLYNLKDQVLSTYGSWRAVPSKYAQPIQQLQDAISSWDQQANVAARRETLQQQVVALGNAIQEQGHQDKTTNVSASASAGARRKTTGKLNVTSPDMAGVQKPQAQKMAPIPTAPKAMIQERFRSNKMAKTAPIPTAPKAMMQESLLSNKMAKMAPIPTAPKAMMQEPFLSDKMAKMIVNPNFIPLSNKRNASVHDSQMTEHVAKRPRLVDFDVPPRLNLSNNNAWGCRTEKTNDSASKNSPYMSDEPARVFKASAFVSDSLDANMINQKCQVSEKKPVLGELVDCRLPSGVEQAELDTDLVRRAPGENE